MTRKTSWIVGCIALVAVLSLSVSPANATLVIGFKFTDNSTSVLVPVGGGTYVVNILASISDVASLADFGVKSGYVGALSAILNSNLGNGTLDGDVTSSSVPTAWGGAAKDGGIGDNQPDARDDLGPVNGVTKSNSDGGGGTINPFWMRQNSGATAVLNGGTGAQVIGTFTVTIPAYTANANSGDFLRYALQNDPTGGGADWSWAEVVGATTTQRAGNNNTATGTSFVNVGTDVTFAAVGVPEPATLVLLGLGGLGLVVCRRWRRS